MYKKYYRRDPTDRIGGTRKNTGFKDDYIEYSTYRLNRSAAVAHYARDPAGGAPSPPPDAHESQGEGPEEDADDMGEWL